MNTIAIILFIILIIFLFHILIVFYYGARKMAKITGEYNIRDIKCIYIVAFMVGVAVCLLFLYIYK